MIDLSNVSMIFFSVCLLVVYRKATNFWELFLYPATLLNLFIHFRSSLIEFWGSVKYSISFYGLYFLRCLGWIFCSYLLCSFDAWCLLIWMILRLFFFCPDDQSVGESGELKSSTVTWLLLSCVYSGLIPKNCDQEFMWIFSDTMNNLKRRS